MQIVSTPHAPTPGGHYSQAVVYGGLVYVAGQLPLDPQRPGEPPPAGIEAQTELVLDHLAAILTAAGSSLRHLLSVTIYVTDIAQWGAVNAIYARRLGVHRPARAVVPVNGLHYGCLLELQAVAALAPSEP